MKNEYMHNIDEWVTEIGMKDGTKMGIRGFSSQDRSAPVCIILPAMGVRANYYQTMANEFAQSGMHAVVCDLRGHGGSSVRPSKFINYGYKEVLNIDLPAIVDAVKAYYQCNQVTLVGHSLGAQLGLLYATQANHVSGVVMIASGSNCYKNIENRWRRWGRYLGYNCIGCLSTVLGYFPGERFKFAGKEFKGLIQDWLHEGFTGRYRVKGSSLNYERLLENTKLPVLFLYLVGDTYVTQKCSDFLAEKLKSAKVTRIELQPQDVGLRTASHFKWVKHPQVITEHILQWL